MLEVEGVLLDVVEGELSEVDVVLIVRVNVLVDDEVAPEDDDDIERHVVVLLLMADEMVVVELVDVPLDVLELVD